MKYIFVSIFIYLSTTVFSQISGTVIDESSNNGIAYINIWVENNNIGTTTNEKGEFELNINTKSKILIFSGIGYATKKININQLTKEVKLKSITTELKEVRVYSKKKTKQLSIDKFKKSKFNSSFATSGTPWMVAKYFPHLKEYKNTPFLSKFVILTRSDIKNAKFNIRLYTKGKNGCPDVYLYDKNIFGIAKKGKKYTEVDVSNLNIQFPNEGFFIATEWLIIEDNKYEYKYTMENSKKKYRGISYQPTFSAIPVNSPNNSWIYRQGKWTKIWRNKEKKVLNRYRGKYNQLAIELILSN